jgi:hypothetical protein
MTRRNQKCWLQSAFFAIVVLLGISILPAMGQQPAATIQPSPANNPEESIHGDNDTPHGKTVSAAATPAPEPKSYRIIHLKYGNASEIGQMLENMIADVRIHIDPRTNSMVFLGTHSAFEKALNIIEALDVPASIPKARSNSVDVRIIWLVDGDAAAAKPTDDLKGVVEELHRLGLNDVRQVAQTMVKSQLNGQTFHVSCLPIMDGKFAQLTAAGMIVDSNGLTMQIHMSVTRSEKPGTGFDKLVELDLATTIQENQYLVLGVAPIGKITSVFVIQVIPAPLPAAPPVKIYKPR